MQKVLKIAMALGVGGALLASSAQGASAPSSVRIRSISYAGTGCPAGTIGGYMVGGYKGFRLDLDNFVAETGPYVPFSEKRKNCSILLNLEFPAGWSFTVADVEHRGYVGLDYGVTATQQTSYYFQGAVGTATLKSTINGPISASYRIRDTLGIESQVWSPCGASRALVMNAQARVDSRSSYAEGIMTIDRIQGSVQHVYGLAWKRCN